MQGDSHPRTIAISLSIVNQEGFDYAKGSWYSGKVRKADLMTSAILNRCGVPYVYLPDPEEWSEALSNAPSCSKALPSIEETAKLKDKMPRDQVFIELGPFTPLVAQRARRFVEETAAAARIEARWYYTEQSVPVDEAVWERFEDEACIEAMQQALSLPEEAALRRETRTPPQWARWSPTTMAFCAGITCGAMFMAILCTLVG